VDATRRKGDREGAQASELSGGIVASPPAADVVPTRAERAPARATPGNAAPVRRTPKFRRRAEARPDEVLDAALDLFIEKGYAAARVEDIARRAGLSKGAVYLYFPSKEAILAALVRRAIVPIAESAVATLGAAPGNPRDTFLMLFRLMRERLGHPRVLAIPKLIVREVGAFPELAEMYRREVIDRALPVLVGVVRRGVENGLFRPVDPELAVRSIIGPIAMHLLMAEVFGLVPEGGLDLEGLIETHIDILFNGLINREQAP
jgi:AcrR family transcriptional regulator